MTGLPTARYLDSGDNTNRIDDDCVLNQHSSFALPNNANTNSLSVRAERITSCAKVYPNEAVACVRSTGPSDLPVLPKSDQPSTHAQALLQQDFSDTTTLQKRKREVTGDNFETSMIKKMRQKESVVFAATWRSPTEFRRLPQVYPSARGQSTYNENDVLCGRGGGTNMHPGNRYFRELVDEHRRTYLKSRKNDKPSISQAIVEAVRLKGGKFLKKCDETDLWFEIGNESAHEKTSQALRQKAPEMRKLLQAQEDYEASSVFQLQQHQREQQHYPRPIPFATQSSMSSMLSIMALQATANNSQLTFLPEVTTFQDAEMDPFREFLASK